MGSSSSKPETPEERRQRQIREYGVLIPPTFAVVNPHQKQDNGGISKAVALQHRLSPLAAYDRLPVSPSLVDYLCGSHFGHGLLYDYMTPGMWVLAGSSGIGGGSATTTIRASLPHQVGGSSTTTTTNTTNNSNFMNHQGGGRISFASASPSGSSRVELNTGTEGPMHLLATHQLFSNGYLYGNLNTHGSGYIGGQVGVSFASNKNKNTPATAFIKDTLEDIDKKEFAKDPLLLAGELNADADAKIDSDNSVDDKIHVQVGSWVPLQWKSSNKNRSILQPLGTPNDASSSLPHEVNVFLSVDMLGSTTAVETKWNTQTMDTDVSKYFSIRLDGGTAADDKSKGSSSSSPPLWLTMTSTPQTSTINVSQLLTFDRLNFNTWDARAPRVRNTLGWTVQLEKPNNDNNTIPASASQISVAAAWQCNRALAFKVVGRSNSGNSNNSNTDPQYSLTYGMLMKRWKQPRVTCSLLGRFDFQTKKSCFVGIGIDLETDASTLLGGGDSLYAPGGGGTQVSDEIPETKATLD